MTESTHYTHAERIILACLASGETVCYAAFTVALYGHRNVAESNVLQVLISRLRRKLGRGRIETIHGQGYRMPAVTP
jgi:two-component system OmpR family response regulator